MLKDKDKELLQDKYDILMLNCEDSVVVFHNNKTKTFPLTKKNTLVKLDNKINLYINGNSSYNNITSIIQEAFNLNKYSMDVYATSYGIGIDNLFGEKNIEKIEKILKEKNIQYRRETSNANWVTRIIISKKSNNLNKLK